MWPMVPTLTCGLVLLNFSFAMVEFPSCLFLLVSAVPVIVPLVVRLGAPRWSWGRDLNPRPRPYQGRAPPLSYPSGSRALRRQHDKPILSKSLDGRIRREGKTDPLTSRNYSNRHARVNKIDTQFRKYCWTLQQPHVDFLAAVRMQHAKKKIGLPSVARRGCERKMERGTGFEPATTSLEGWCSATELPPR